MQIIIEGWRFIAHSYSIVNQFQCLELLNRPEVQIFHRDLPYFAPHWQPTAGLLDATAEALLNSIPSPTATQHAEALLRMGYPYDFSTSPTARTYVFGTAELGVVKQVAIVGGASLKQVHHDSEAVIITPSDWSRAGLIRSGADQNRVKVVPHGVDTHLFHPLTVEERNQLRAKLGWDGFVFLNIGGMGGNKGVHFLLKTFAVLAEEYPNIRLALKGLDSMYGSSRLVNEMTQTLTEAEVQRLQERSLYIGEALTFREMAQLYQAADAYVSPYFAEGFNLPVLEAIACGLPVICTQGGPTDEFIHPDFALAISSQLQEIEVEPGAIGTYLLPDIEHLLTLMQQMVEQPALAARARQAGPNWVAEHFTWRHCVDRLLNVFRGRFKRCTV